MLSQEPFRLVRLANGVFSIHSVAHGETCHPVVGPAAEAEALYAGQLRLRERLARERGEFVVWDVGLGAAANALAVIEAAREVPAKLRLISFDQTLEPLRFALHHAAELGYFGGSEPLLGTLLNDGRVAVALGSLDLEWSLVVADFPSWTTTPEAEQTPKPHAILFDAYSPAKNPVMWTLPLFQKLHRLTDPNRPCSMPTYSRSTMLRVTMLLAGFFVGKGHAVAEKEETTIAANRLELIEEPLDRKWLTRARHSTSAEPMREPHYRQSPLTEDSWGRLLCHAQFRDAG